MVECDNIDPDIQLPSLIFTSFVENAVKYSIPVHGTQDVKVSFRCKGKRLLFLCENSYDANKIMSMSHIGIGVRNTLRRLRLLYDESYIYDCQPDGKTYRVLIEIPVR